ncbi:MAG: hypothetical protein R3D00_01165 [Bacteroidia bacterium]
MRFLIFGAILWVFSSYTPIQSQILRKDKIGISLQLRLGHVYPPQHFVPTFYVLPPALMFIEDFPRMEIRPLAGGGLKAEYRLRKKWLTSLGIHYQYYQLNGRVGSVQSSLSRIFEQSWSEINAPVEFTYAFPLRQSGYGLAISLGTVFAGYFWDNTARHGVNYRENTMIVRLQPIRLVNVRYRFRMAMIFPLKKEPFQIGLEGDWARFSPIRLEISHYILDDPSGFGGLPDPEYLTYQYWQKIFPHQVSLFISIPLVTLISEK